MTAWTPEMMEQRDPACARAVALIRATREEMSMLWMTRSNASSWRASGEPGIEWRGNGGGGPGICIGWVAEMPVNISLSIDSVGGVPVCIYEMVSQMVDDEMAERFLDQAFPGVARFAAESFDDFVEQLGALRSLADAKPQRFGRGAR